MMFYVFHGVSLSFLCLPHVFPLLFDDPFLIDVLVDTIGLATGRSVWCSALKPKASSSSSIKRRHSSSCHGRAATCSPIGRSLESATARRAI